jgi:2-hydroxy-6-oxonona-2,4-dienedioate hydrolase
MRSTVNHAGGVLDEHPSTQSRTHELAFVAAGHGPDLVLLHGGVGSWTHWSRNMQQLSRYFRVRAFDLPGFGASPTFLAERGDEAYFQWVADAICAAEHESIRLVGFSFGGSVAAAIAPSMGNRLASLTLVAPGGFGVPVGRKVDVRSIRPREGVETNPREAARHNLSQVMFADPASVDDVTIDLHLHNIECARFNSRRLSWQDRLEGDLAPVTCPIQLIWGGSDRMATPSVEARAERCRGIRRGVRVDIVPGAGHWVQYECPAAFDAVLLDFLRDIPD